MIRNRQWLPWSWSNQNTNLPDAGHMQLAYAGWGWWGWWVQKCLWARKPESSKFFDLQQTTHLSMYGYDTSTKNIMPIHWKMRFPYNAENLRAPTRLLVSFFFLNAPFPPPCLEMCWFIIIVWCDIHYIKVLLYPFALNCFKEWSIGGKEMDC